MTYSDNIKSESDTIEVELDDTDGRWLDKWYPGKGDTLTLKMGYQGEKLLSCGTFSIDEIEVSSPASVVAIRGRGHVGQQRPADKIQPWFREHHAGGHRRADCQKASAEAGWQY
ncbi:Gene D protein [Enterobacter asburiae]|uniref:Gene D protein n=1 Tax=Enterobacter asburiae TaxID=61645 RepID=A0A376FEI8_ENTAS|nr:Gene D protein [Enterobacter asburiae]